MRIRIVVAGLPELSGFILFVTDGLQKAGDSFRCREDQ